MINIQYKKISADRFTPLSVLKKLSGKALLESAVLEIGRSRYSLLMLEEDSRLILEERGVVLVKKTSEKIISIKKEDYFDILQKETAKNTSKQPLPFPLPAGGIGYMSYETVRLFEEVNFAAQKNDYKIPEAIFCFGSLFAIFDHYRDEIYLAGHGKNIKEKINNAIERLLDKDYRCYDNDEKKYTCRVDLNKDKENFIKGVKKVKKEIINGNLLQGVLSRRIELISKIPPLEAYRRLRHENPSPYLFYLDFDQFKLFGSSPEVMVKVEKGNALLKPIAGTRKRGKNHAEDIEMEEELLADPKERAEHLMLIDLARNDLGRIAAAGSVKVERSFFIERFARVMHIVSEVEAKFKKGTTTIDVIKAVFPAGTVSGAPKIKAMEIISELEKQERGPYAGLVGYFNADGSFDSCIVIRSVLNLEQKYYLQAGAGIVYDSQPEKEFQETINKASALLKAMGVEIK